MLARALEDRRREQQRRVLHVLVGAGRGVEVRVADHAVLAGQTPQQIEALLVFVTVGMTARARVWIPRAAQLFNVGIGLRS